MTDNDDTHDGATPLRRLRSIAPTEDPAIEGPKKERADDTLDGAALQARLGSIPPLELLMDALSEMQICSLRFLQALEHPERQRPMEALVHAHDAFAWWEIAKACLPRLVVRSCAEGHLHETKLLQQVNGALES